MSKFKVGDRVSVAGWTYHANCPLGAHAEIVGFGEHHPEIVNIKWLKGVHAGSTDSVHERQCRRLVKKERRRVWVQRVMVGVKMKYIEWDLCSSDDWIEFVEVKPKRARGIIPK